MGRSPDIVLFNIPSTDDLSWAGDLETVQRQCSAALGLVLPEVSTSIRSKAIRSGADGVHDRRHLTLQSVEYILGNMAARAERDRRRLSLQATREISQITAPLNYLEFGLITLSDVLSDTGKERMIEFVEHLRETIQAVRKYAEADMSALTQASIGRLIESSRARMRRLADDRKVALRVNWERANFHHAGSSDMAQLGLQHLLEGVIRCCAKGDGVWMQGERTEEASAIKIHMSRRVLPSSDILFPRGRISPGIGLDALSTLQLGALLLQIAPQQVHLGNEGRHQMLSIQL